MAAPDPRRSSRARTTQSQSQLSSTSSGSSGRPDKNTRVFNKSGSPQKSTPTASLSSEPPEDSIAAAEDTFSTRRRTRGQADERSSRPGPDPGDVDMANPVDDIQEDDEAVRCICGSDEYPGPPPLDDDPKHGVKDSIDIEPIFTADVTDDLAGFFVQCDICKVWQHGACVGIMTEESSPEEYFCEQCRKDLHKIFTAKNGQRYSHYLPLNKRHSQTTSRAGSLVKETTRSPREKDSRNARSASSNQMSKRRSTMNSREAAYDEAEALRRAIEESKEEAMHDPADGSITRRAKRGRSPSEEKQENTKRQRTSSRSLSPLGGATFEDSDDAMMATRNGTSKSKSRSSAMRTQRAEKMAEREERERQRAEAASKRKGRAERRRADDSDPSEEMPLAARAAISRAAAASAHAVPSAEEQMQGVEPQASTHASPDTPPAHALAANNNSAKTASRSHKKRGRNQYTRDRDGQEEDSPARSQSRDIQKEEISSAGASKAHGVESGKPGSKTKGGLSSKVTMNDLKRRATAILDFISRTQVEMAGETPPGISQPSPRPSDDGRPVPAKDDSERASSDKEPPDSGSGGGGSSDSHTIEVDPARDFKELNCLEMMDSLTRQLVKWQQEYAA